MWRTLRSPACAISFVALARVSTLRTSLTDAEEIAKSCSLTRNRMICSVRTGCDFAGAGRRIYLAPTGVFLQMPMTRFSMAA